MGLCSLSGRANKELQVPPLTSFSVCGVSVVCFSTHADDVLTRLESSDNLFGGICFLVTDYIGREQKVVIMVKHSEALDFIIIARLGTVPHMDLFDIGAVKHHSSH